MTSIFARGERRCYWQIVCGPEAYQAAAHTIVAVRTMPTATNQGTQRSVNIVPLPRSAGPDHDGARDRPIGTERSD